MLAILGLALLMGMHHALEADHVAAVSSLVSGKSRLGDIVGHGLTWGAGHTLTLFLFAGAALVFGQTVPEVYSSRLEAAVGLMLVLLGAHVLWRMWCDRIHFHAHRHGDGKAHFHAHSHAGERLHHRCSSHRHAHRFRWRALAVGMTHGMAGSGALLLLMVTEVGNAWEGLAYVLVFGLGSMAGMAVVCAAIGVPMTMSAQFFTRAHRGLQGVVGATTIAIGVSTLHMTLVAA